MARKQRNMQKRPVDDIERRLQTCLEYNRQWQEVATGLERQKNELLAIIQQLQAEKEHWKTLAMTKAGLQ